MARTWKSGAGEASGAVFSYRGRGTVAQFIASLLDGAAARRPTIGGVPRDADHAVLAATLADRSARLAESEDRFRTYAAASSDWYWEMDAGLRFTEILPPPTATLRDCGRLLGKTRWEAAGVDPSADAKWRGHRDTLLAREPFRDFEYDHLTPDGDNLPVRVNGLPVFDAAGRFKGYRGVGRDITAERTRQAEEARLRDKVATLARRERLGTIGLLASGLAHELKQPLAAIALYSARLQALADAGETPPEGFAGTLAEIQRLTDVAAGIIRQAAQVVGGRDGAIYRTCCCAVAREVLRVTGPDMAAVGISVDLRCEEISFVVAIDPLGLQLILLNLLHNARDSLVSAAVADPRIDIVIRQETPGAIAVIVADNGPGIAETDRASVFEPFITSKSNGTGLGLTISRHLAEVQGGDLTIQAGAGGRSVMKLLLPRAEGLPKNA